MRIYYNVEFTNEISGTLYFDGFTIRKGNKDYYIDLIGEYDFSNTKNETSGRFKGSINLVDLETDSLIKDNLSFEDMEILFEDSVLIRTNFVDSTEEEKEVANIHQFDICCLKQFHLPIELD